MGRIIHIALLLMWSTPLLAQGVSSDRPDFTDGTATVAPGALQVEAGLTYAVDGPTINAPQLLLRTGIVENLEARVIGPDAVIVDGETNAGSMVLGAKYSRTVSDGFTLGVLPSFTTPVTGDAVDADGLSAGVALLWAWDVTNGWGLSGNLGTAVSGFMSGADETSSQHFVTLSSGFSLTGSLSFFVESYALIADETTVFGDAGLLYVLNPNLQLDVSAGMPFEGESSGWFGGGVAVLF